MTFEVINVFLENTTFPLDIIKLIVSLIEPCTFDFDKVYKEREDHVWKFKVIKKTKCYVTLGQFINPNLPHRSELKRKIKYDPFGSEYVELWSKKAKLYA
jgi:hypothetical protein